MIRKDNFIKWVDFSIRTKVSQILNGKMNINELNEQEKELLFKSVVNFEQREIVEDTDYTCEYMNEDNGCLCHHCENCYR